MIRCIALFIVGVVVGAGGLFFAVQITGGWYRYSYVQSSMCGTMVPNGAEIVLSNAYTCQYRRPRWDFLN